MKRRVILLALSGLAVMITMLALSSDIVQPVIAQSPTPRYWMECSPWTHYILPSSRWHTDDWGTSSEDHTGYNIIDRIPYSTTIRGVYAEMSDYQTIPDGDGLDGMDAWESDSGVRRGPFPDSWHVENGVPDSYSGCSDLVTDGLACTGVGLTRDGNLDDATWDDGFINDGGIYQNGSGASFYSHVCVIYWSPPPPEPECGTGEITDTHFIYDSWTTSGASWHYSFYDIAPGGSVSKQGHFLTLYGDPIYGGAYIVNVIARSVVTGVLNITAGGDSTPITITASPSFNIYTGTLIVTVDDEAGHVDVVMSNAADGIMTVDQICINNSNAMSCGVIQDYHFKLPTSWLGSGGAEWLGTWPGAWRMEYGGAIAQSIAISASGTYSVMASVKQIIEGPTTELGILVNGNEVGSLSFTGSADWIIVTTTVQLEALYGELKLTPTGGTLIDWFCLEPGNVSVTGYPCGITAADIANSSLYISNSKMDTGVHVAVPGGFVGIGPLAFSIGDFSAYLLQDWQSFEVSTWFLELIAGDVDGAYRIRDGGPALGLIPRAFVSTRQDLATNIADDYNVVLRMKPKYENSQLYVNGVAAPTGIYQEWSDASVFVNGSAVALTADCGSLLAGCTPQNGTIDVVEVDDVYVVPGPQLTCGSFHPISTPIGTCINPNPDFTLGNADWTVSGGAYIDNVYGWAVLPGGSMLQQQVPTGGAWDQSSTGINVGYSYVIAVGAHLEHSNVPGQFTVMVGASQPGQQSFNHQLITPIVSNESTDTFTVTSDMLNGTSMDIRIANEAGGTVMLDYVCIRYNGGPGTIPPNGQCLGTWYTSDGLTPAINPGPLIPANNYVKNTQASMGGGYTLDLAGVKEESNSTFALDYCNATSGRCDSIGTIPLSEPEFSESFSFVVPAGGYYGGELRLENDDAVTYDNLCLRQSQNGPGNTNPPSPPALPMPECGSVNNTASFYMLTPYSVTNEFTGTEYTAAYLSELIYNYSIYPLVCTTVSIGNWQYRTYVEFKMFFLQYIQMVWTRLDLIITILYQILDKIGSGGGGNPWWWDLLNLFLLLLKLLLELLIKILSFIFPFVVKFIRIFGGISGEARGENALMFDLSCGGDGAWMCFVLAGIAELDWKLGDWLNIVSLFVVSMLTVSLVFWTVNQVRDMLQPGGGSDTSG